MSEELRYQQGFGNALSSEARPGALPARQNTPRRPPYGLFAEMINGTGFTVERARNRRTWMYRLRPLMHDRGWVPIDAGRWWSAFHGALATPEAMRWQPKEDPLEPTDFVGGITTLAGAGSPALRAGLATHLFAANTDMDRVFANADGDLLVVPWQGHLRVRTELGVLEVSVGELLLLPRGIRFAVSLPDGTAKGFVAELYDGPLGLPERGLVGSNGLADERHFLAPVASFEDRAEDTVCVVKQRGQLWQTTLPHSPFDVVAWHGTHVPFKYDLANFAPLSSVAFDHADPSIYTVLSTPADDHGSNALDVAAFVARWDPTEDTFRPPFLHRNVAMEVNMVLRNTDGGAWKPGTCSFTPSLTPHSVGASTYHRFYGMEEEPGPTRLSDDSLWLQFESAYQLAVTPWMYEARERGFLEAFRGYPEADVHRLVVAD